MRGGADGVGASRPQLVPSTILRKNFEFIAAIKPHEVPNRPQFYMIGSGITEASLNAVTIGATCTHEDWRAPCFTTAEIALAKTQLSEEQVAFDALSVEEQAAHTAEGGLAVRSYRPCSSMPNMITNTQCKDMTHNPDRFTAETCEASCCDSSCQTWLFEEGEGCYHSENACTVMWQGTGGATGWNGGSALRLIEACACRECGKPTDTTKSLGWTNGICGIATDSCSGTSPIQGGCYSTTSSHCDCSTRKTV
jgi:hypothetical protein